MFQLLSIPPTSTSSYPWSVANVGVKGTILQITCGDALLGLRETHKEEDGSYCEVGLEGDLTLFFLIVFPCSPFSIPPPFFLHFR